LPNDFIVPWLYHRYNDNLAFLKGVKTVALHAAGIEAKSLFCFAFWKAKKIIHLLICPLKVYMNRFAYL
jgi:hypothetical protein